MVDSTGDPPTRAYHCCDYCDQFRTDTTGLVNRAGQLIGYACLWCQFMHEDSIRRRKAEGGSPNRGGATSSPVV